MLSGTPIASRLPFERIGPDLTPYPFLHIRGPEGREEGRARHCPPSERLEALGVWWRASPPLKISCWRNHSGDTIASFAYQLGPIEATVIAAAIEAASTEL